MNKITTNNGSHGSYATAADFRAVFEQDMAKLYSLAFLLTADEQTAEQCFVRALNECVHSAVVYSGWERSWSRRAIVKQAIRLVRPRPDDSVTAMSTSGLTPADVPGLLIRLRPFDRFVYAMTVLERYTNQECAALLKCAPSGIERARFAVLQSFRGVEWPARTIADEPRFVLNTNAGQVA